MNDTSFLASFTNGTLAPADFDHSAHIRAACLLLQSRPFLEACIAMRDGLRHIAAQAGKPQLYHETITVAFMAIVANKLTGEAADWQTVVATERDLFDSTLLNGHYTPELLASARARSRFILPDRAPGQAA